MYRRVDLAMWCVEEEREGEEGECGYQMYRPIDTTVGLAKHIKRIQHIHSQVLMTASWIANIVILGCAYGGI